MKPKLHNIKGIKTNLSDKIVKIQEKIFIPVGMAIIKVAEAK